MSHESLEAFRRRLETDDELLARVRQARAVATVEVAKAFGFDITAEELQALIDEAGTEISDERLEAVAGGLLDMPFALREDPSS